MDLNTIVATINAIAIAILVVVTAFYAHSTHKLLNIEEEREKGKARKTLNILLAEFKLNKWLLGDLVDKVKITNTGKDYVFLGFREDGWNEIRNQCGYEYIKSLYDKITPYYIEIYKIGKMQEEWHSSYILTAPSRAVFDKYYAFLDSLSPCRRSASFHLRSSMARRTRYSVTKLQFSSRSIAKTYRHQYNCFIFCLG